MSEFDIVSLAALSKTKGVSDQVEQNTQDITELQNTGVDLTARAGVDTNSALISQLGAEIDNHKPDNMPHILTDLQTSKRYRFGLQVSAEGNPQLIYEEVI